MFIFQISSWAESRSKDIWMCDGYPIASPIELCVRENTQSPDKFTQPPNSMHDRTVVADWRPALVNKSHDWIEHPESYPPTRPTNYTPTRYIPGSWKACLGGFWQLSTRSRHRRHDAHLHTHSRTRRFADVSTILMVKIRMTLRRFAWSFASRLQTRVWCFVCATCCHCALIHLLLSILVLSAIVSYCGTTWLPWRTKFVVCYCPLLPFR
jgi:hypothetical protein